MRFLAIIPLVFSTAAFIIAFLCIFAGSKPGFMDGYEILSLNTSRVGQNLLSAGSGSGGSSTVSSIINGLGLGNTVSSLTTSLAHSLGIEDFYAVHVLDYCEGSYTPQSTPNATLSFKNIHQNVSRCSGRGSGINFTPGQAIQQTLDRTGTGITLKDLNWDEDIDNKVHDLQILLKVMLAFYCLAIAFAFFTMIGSLVHLIKPTSGRGTSAVTSIMGFLAFMAMGIASGLVTAIAVKGDHVIDKYGEKVGISANRSNKLLALTWAGTALLFISMLIGCCGICFGNRKKKMNEKGSNYS